MTSFTVRPIAPDAIPEATRNGKYSEVFEAIEKMTIGTAFEVSPLTNREVTYIRYHARTSAAGVTVVARKLGNEQYALYISK